MSLKHKCASCQSDNLYYGGVSGLLEFSSGVPFGRSHHVFAFVCLDCGVLGYYLDEESIQSLHQLKAQIKAKSSETK